MPRLASLPIILFHCFLVFGTVSISLSYIAHGMPPHDIAAFFTAGRILNDGRGDRLYDLELQHEYQSKLDTPNGQFLPYLNPPHVSPLFAVFGSASFGRVSSVWAAMELGLIAMVCFLLWRSTEKWSIHERVLSITTFASSAFVLYTVFAGSLSILIAVSLFLWYRNLQSGRETKAGLWLTLATLKPQVALFPFVGTLERKRAALSTIVAVVLLGLLSILVLGWHTWLDYYRMTQITQTEPDPFKYLIDPAKMVNLRALLMIGGLTIRQSWTFASVVSAIGLVLTPFVVHRLRLDLRVALLLPVGLFLSPHANAYDLASMALPAVILYDQWRGTSRGRIFGLFIVGVSSSISAMQLFGLHSIALRIPLFFIIGMIGWAIINSLSFWSHNSPLRGLNTTSDLRPIATAGQRP